jgi:hypothetical protein
MISTTNFLEPEASPFKCKDSDACTLLYTVKENVLTVDIFTLTFYFLHI